MRFRALVLAGGLVLAAPTAAQNSHCAALAGDCAGGSARRRQCDPGPAHPARLHLPARLHDRNGRPRHALPPARRHAIEDREPRRDCYAALGLGPVRNVPTQMKPTMSCPGTPSINSIVAIRGPQCRLAGRGDDCATERRRRHHPLACATGGRTPAAEDPTRQDCFPHDCRLMRITTRAGTPARVEMTLATPNNAASTSFTLNTEATCPGR
jgi:hypothetical protein